MGLLDSDGEEPKSKVRRYIVSGAVLLILLSAGFWYLFRFHAEKKTVGAFLDAVVREDFQEAHRIWKPTASYSFPDFLDDWGPNGYYGPIKSYHIEAAQKMRGASGVIVVVELSPFTSFPSENDREKIRQMKEVRLWVERKTQAISFPP